MRSTRNVLRSPRVWSNADEVPEPVTEKQPVRFDGAIDLAVQEVDRRPPVDRLAQHRQARQRRHRRHDRRLAVDHARPELPQRLLAELRAGARRSDRDLQRPHLVGLEAQVGELVAGAVDPVLGRAGVRPADDDLLLDRHAEVAQRSLVAFEGAALRSLLLGILATQLAGDLDEAERFGGLEQQGEQVGEALDPLGHQREPYS